MRNKVIVAACMLLLSPALAFAGKDFHHTAGLFLGSAKMKDETVSTYGFEYEYKFNKLIGAGVVYERADEAHHNDGMSVTIGSFYLHPFKALRLGFGVGEEKIGGDKGYTKDLYRTSVSYDFHIGDYGIAPTAAFDSIDGETVEVYGIAFLRSF